MSDEVERVPGQGVAELAEAVLRPPVAPPDPAPTYAAVTAAGQRSLTAASAHPAHRDERRSRGTRPRGDVVAALIGAEVGAAIGLLWFGWTPLMPIAVTLGSAALAPVLVRASRPLRRLLFRHWLRSQLSGPSSP